MSKRCNYLFFTVQRTFTWFEINIQNVTVNFTYFFRLMVELERKLELLKA